MNTIETGNPRKVKTLDKFYELDTKNLPLSFPILDFNKFFSRSIVVNFNHNIWVWLRFFG